MTWRDVCWQFRWREPFESVCLVVQGQRAAIDDTGEGEDQLVALRAVIHKRQPPYADLKPGLLTRFADHSLPQRFAMLDLPARQVPHVDVAPVAKQEACGIVIQERKRAEIAH